MSQTNFNTSATGTPTTGTLNTSISVSSGDIVICCLGSTGVLPTGSNLPILDPTGSNTAMTLFANSSNGSGASVGIYYATASSTASLTVSATSNGTDNIDMVLLSIVNAPTCSFPDGTSISATGSGTSVSPGTLTGTYKGLYFTAVGSPSSNTVSAGLTNYNSTYVGVASYYGQTTSFNATATLSNSVQWASVTVHIDDLIETTISLSPNPTSTPVNTTKQIFASLFDQCSTAYTDTVTWAMVSGGGSINSSTGVYSAPSSATVAVVRATASEGKTTTATITVTNPAAQTSFLLAML